MKESLIIQGIGIVAMAVYIFSYQMPTRKSIVAMQTVSAGLFLIHFGFLGATTGAVLNGIGSFRSFVFSHSDKPWAQKKMWLWFFLTLSVAAYPATFLLFGEEATVRNLLLGVLPVCGMILTTFACRSTSSKRLRLLSLLNSPFWMTYNAFNGSIGGTVTEIISSVSIIVGYFRYDHKKKHIATEQEREK